MAHTVSEIREENRELQAAYQRGEQQKIWKSKSQAARLIRVAVATFNHQYLGYAHGKGVQETTRLLLEKIHVGHTEDEGLRSLYRRGKAAGKWKNTSACARVLKIDRGSLVRYLEIDPQKLSAKATSYYERLLRAMRRKVGKPRRDPEDPKEGAQAPPTPSGQIIESPYYDRLLAGVAELADQHLGGIRFVLTRRNFRTLKGIVTKEEVNDTKLLIEELRRRLNLLTQIDSETIRSLCHKVLGPELSELFLSYRLFQEVVPTAAAEEIDVLRSKFQQFHN